MTKFRIKRIYESVSDDDGCRILVDRLWPRGVSKSAAAMSEWCKDVAPSNELRSWFGHEPKRFDEFREKYIAELNDNTHVVDDLRNLVATAPVVTLLYSARDEVHNQAVVLQGYLQN